MNYEYYSSNADNTGFIVFIIHASADNNYYAFHDAVAFASFSFGLLICFAHTDYMISLKIRPDQSLLATLASRHRQAPPIAFLARHSHNL